MTGDKSSPVFFLDKMFECDKCGLCCKNISNIPIISSLDRGDGICKNYDDETRLCKIYENRPLACNVDLGFEKYFSKFYTKEEYYKLNYELCEKMKKEEQDKKQEICQLSVNIANFIPILNKWLNVADFWIYELTANAIDSINKYKYYRKSDSKDDFKFSIDIDKEKRIIIFSDNGIGMTANDIKKYLCTFAYSNSFNFVNKINKSNLVKIYGSSGIGFWSVFSVSDKVEIESLSYKKDSEPVHWSWSGSSEYTISKGNRKERGTDIILHIEEGRDNLLDKDFIKNAIFDDSLFIPIPVFINGERINNGNPIWNQLPNDLKEKDYLELFKLLYPNEDIPKFYKHISISEPFKFNAIIYKPENVPNDSIALKLFSDCFCISNSVYELLPKSLFGLKGVIDCPDMPLRNSKKQEQDIKEKFKVIESIIIEEIEEIEKIKK